MISESAFEELKRYKELLECLKVFIAEGTVNMDYPPKIKDKLTERINEILETQFELLKPEEAEVEEIAEKAEEEKVEEEKTETEEVTE